MRVILLQLSDIHMTTGLNPIANRISRIADTLNLCTDEPCTCFLLISGDIAKTGNMKEYDIAFTFISSLLTEIATNAKICAVHSIIIPGNHDCNFNKVKTTRGNLIDHLKAVVNPFGLINQDFIAELTSIQDEYFSFAQRFGFSNDINSRIYWVKEYSFEQFCMRFICLNTAWMSSKLEKQGSLIFPVSMINISEDISQQNCINITLFHHPFNWFDVRYSRDFKNFIQSYSDIIITGHEHDADSQTHTSIKGNINELMSGGLLQYKSKKDSSFNINLVDLKSLKQKKYLFIWQDQQGFYKPELETEWKQFSPREERNKLSIKESFRLQLSCLDYQISHPKLFTPLKMDDIYVNPSMRFEYSKQGLISQKPETTNDIDYLLKIIKDYKRVLILGNKYAGKSLLLRKLFLLLFENNYIPLYCDGPELLRLYRQTENSIKQMFENQFDNIGDIPYQKYRQIALEKKVILVDDLNKIDNDMGKLDSILNILCCHFGSIVLASNSTINLKEMFNGHFGVLIDYTRVKLNDFGLPLVSEIVEKWTRLVNPESAEKEIQNRIKVVENNLFNRMSRDITPRNPFFITTILYNLDTQMSPEAQTGAFGYYFQTIINVELAKIARKPELIGHVYDYFSYLAFFMLMMKTGLINETQLQELKEKYLERTGLTLDLDQIMENAIKEEVLKYQNGDYSFTQNYYFEFFCAKYIGDNIRNPHEQELICRVVDKISLHIHKEVYSNIMMFLCFHSKDHLILDTVTQRSRQVFRDNEKFDMHNDVEFLNQLVPQTKIHAISAKDTQETKKELLEAADTINEEIGEIRYGLTQDINKIEDLSTVNIILYGFSLVKVLGQIIRRYSLGDLEERIIRTKEVYDLGLSVIKYVLNQIKWEIPVVQEDVASLIQARNPSIAPDKLGIAANDWIWMLCESICMSSIKNISHNAGAPELQKVYKLILERYPDIAYEFIDISIELDHFEEVPTEKIIKLSKKLDEGRNYFCKDLLSLLFIYHTYQFYTPFKQIQKIASALGLKHILQEPNIFLAGRKMLPKKQN